MRAMRSLLKKPRVSSPSVRFIETTSDFASSVSMSTSGTLDLSMFRAVPADHVHAHAFADARHFAADAAEADDAQRLAEKLHALVRRPGAGAHLAVHAGDVARGRHHQRDRVLGHRGVAIALDDVHLDAARLQLVDIHVARGARAEEHDVLELGALRHQLVGM